MRCNDHNREYRYDCPDCVVAAHRNGVKSRNGDMFIYGSYWGMYSRVLSMNHPEGVIEVDLTAVNPLSDLGWPKVARINIRAHRTSRSPRDMLSYALPDYTVERMHERFGVDLTERLLHEDFLPQIDWAKYRKVCNGGAALADILL